MAKYTPAEKRRQAARTIELLLDHVIGYYGGDDPLKWPTDLLKQMARSLATHRVEGTLPHPSEWHHKPLRLTARKRRL